MTNFWSGRRVFITGHTGFKGSWLSLLLQRRGAEVTGFSLGLPTQPAHFELAGIGKFVKKDGRGDVCDLAALKAAVAAASPEVVFHLAAQPLVLASYESPVETFETNLMGTVNLLEACRQVPGLRVIVNATTDKCYENREQRRGYRETDILGGEDPYAASKSCAELATAAYQKSFLKTTAVATVRAGNVVGGGDWGRYRLIPDLVRAATMGNVLRLRHPDGVRPWQHVLDPLSGYLALAERLWESGDEFSGPWNFGPDAQEVRSVAQLVEIFQANWPGGFVWERDPETFGKEARLLVLDSGKARDGLGWRSRLTVDESLEWTARWYAQVHREPKSAGPMTLEQIDAFESLVPVS